VCGVIIGIGTDLVRFDRMAAARQRLGDRLVQRILGAREQDEYHVRVQHASPGRRFDAALRYLAKRFAAKEAFAKALGLGLRAPMGLQALEILGGEHGRPQAVPCGDLAVWLNARRWVGHVSLSDESDHALAFVLIEHV
jgi:holo-[acyl-carrier protein] synthase